MRKIGAYRLSDGRMRFTVWALDAKTVELHLIDSDQYIPMERDARGYYSCTVDSVAVGERYKYRIDGEKERPDPASRHQPEGVHGASAIIDEDFNWTDDGYNPPTLRNTIFYEMHVGTFTEEGTFEAIIPYLDYFLELGVNALELMPVNQFPGSRNWGYDGVQLFATQNSYGGVDGLRKLVNAAHEKGIAIYLDVVYNHLGPEGNYLWDYTRSYFTDKYKGLWGDNINFDGAHNAEVRNFFIQNALYWIEVCHIDGFRLDATDFLVDFSSVPILEELPAAVHEWADRHNKRINVVAENGESNRKTVLSRELGGKGLDAQWFDDLHHVIHTQLTGELNGYYASYGEFGHMVKTLSEGFVRSGEWSPIYGKQYGSYSGDIPTNRFVVCSQNHDQVGNRMVGERLEHLTSWDGAKIAAGFALLSPYVPLLFMGEEYAESNPFLYFTSHSDEPLIQGVREGRATEFEAFTHLGTPPDPQAESTFERSKLNHDLRDSGKHARMFQFYKDLIQLRKTRPALTNPSRDATRVLVDYPQKVIWLIRRHYYDVVAVGFNWHHEVTARTAVPQVEAPLSEVLSSTDIRYSERKMMKPKSLDMVDGSFVELAPLSFVVYATDNTNQ